MLKQSIVLCISRKSGLIDFELESSLYEQFLRFFSEDMLIKCFYQDVNIDFILVF